MHSNIRILSALGVITAAALAGCASTDASSDVNAKADAVFKSSFAPGPGQDLSRLEQDETQKACSQYRANPPEAVAKAIQSQEAKNIVYPDDGKLMGDW
jgi:sulfur-oxidizing protein SoxX